MKQIAIAILILVGLGYVSWTILYPSATWRYRLTLEVETPEGVKTGSSPRSPQ